MVALITFTALYLQLQVYPNHDVAWVLWGTREMLHGSTWGQDIIEPNPPLAWYLAMPAAWLSGALGTPIAATFQVLVACVAICSLCAFDNLTRHATGRHGFSDVLPTLIAALFLLVLPYRDFGQREHLMLIAALPYLALCAVRFGTGSKVSTATAVMIGFVAGLGFALKPYFLAVPLLVEILGVVISQQASSIFRLETITIGIVVAIYGIFVMTFTPEYVSEVVPLARAIYWSFDLPLTGLVTSISLQILAVLLVAVLSASVDEKLPLVFGVATLGFAVSYLFQQKGYSYHLLPVTAGSSIAVAAMISGSVISKSRRLATMFLLIVMLLNPVLLTLSWWRMSGPGGSAAIAQKRMIDVIDRYAGRGGFMVIAVHPRPAFPTALYTTAHHVSRTNSQWFLPAVAQLRNGRSGAVPNAKEIAEREAKEFVLHDLAQNPSLVILDTDAARHTVGPKEFDILAFYAEDPRFRDVWRHYREVEPKLGYRFFVRDRKSAP